MSTAFHPQIDGQSEATNKIITMYLRCLTGDRPRQWVQWLPWAKFCYNSAFQTSLKTSLFRVVAASPLHYCLISRVRHASQQCTSNSQTGMNSWSKSMNDWSKLNRFTSTSTTRSIVSWFSVWVTEFGYASSIAQWPPWTSKGATSLGPSSMAPSMCSSGLGKSRTSWNCQRVLDYIMCSMLAC
jgi:hypothetical protein